MMVSVQTHLRQFKRKLRRLVRDNRVRMGMKLALLFFGGFFFSAASLREVPQPLAMGLVCAIPGLDDMLSGVDIKRMRDVDVNDLLSRSEVVLNQEAGRE